MIIQRRPTKPNILLITRFDPKVVDPFITLGKYDIPELIISHLSFVNFSVVISFFLFLSQNGSCLDLHHLVLIIFNFVDYPQLIARLLRLRHLQLKFWWKSQIFLGLSVTYFVDFSFLKILYMLYHYITQIQLNDCRWLWMSNDLELSIKNRVCLKMTFTCADTISSC